MVSRDIVGRGMDNRGMIGRGMDNLGMISRGMDNWGMVGRGMDNWGMVGRGMDNWGMVGRCSWSICGSRSIGRSSMNWRSKGCERNTRVGLSCHKRDKSN